MFRGMKKIEAKRKLVLFNFQYPEAGNPDKSGRNASLYASKATQA
jgi:hypothetical protein